jgi:hypothetical protein
MTTLTERSLSYGFGLLGGLLFLLAAAVSLAVGTADLVLGHMIGAMNSGSLAVLYVVVGGLALLFAYLGHAEWSARPVLTGIVLIAISLIGWAILSVGPNLAAVLGAIFVFLAGLMTLASPIASGRVPSATA